MGSINFGVSRTWPCLAGMLLAGGTILLGGDDAEQRAKDLGRSKAVVEPAAANADGSRWKEKFVYRTTAWLPVSVAWSSDGKTMVVGGTDGKVIAVDPVTRDAKWKADVAGGFAAVVFSADQSTILATVPNGIRFLDAGTGRPGGSLDEPESRPTAVGVFPDQPLAIGGPKLAFNHKVVFGNARGYVVKSWIDEAAAGTITLSNTQDPADSNAVPLAIDPAGRSVILTGPMDRATGRNVLWAWVAGNYEAGSPGNRLLAGHQAVVVSAAWSKDGKTAVSGDAMGRVIVWDAPTMKETRRIELGGRVAALALSPEGKTIAAAVIAKQAEFHIIDNTKANAEMQPIHVDPSDFAGPVHACLAFSADGRQLAGSAINRAWLARSGELIGKLHVWEVE